MIAAAADLWRDTAVERVADDAWHAVLGTAWNFQYPSGGVLATVALRAAAAALDDDTQRLVSATTTFCAPLHPGPLRAEVVLLRRGTAASQLRVRLRNHYAPGHEVRASEGLEVTCTFARDRVGPDVRGAAPPDVPGSPPSGRLQPEQNPPESSQPESPVPPSPAPAPVLPALPGWPSAPRPGTVVTPTSSMPVDAVTRMAIELSPGLLASADSTVMLSSRVGSVMASKRTATVPPRKVVVPVRAQPAAGSAPP